MFLCSLSLRRKRKSQFPRLIAGELILCLSFTPHAFCFVLFHFVAEDAIYLDDTCSNNSFRANFVSEFLFATSEPGFVCPKKNTQFWNLRVLIILSFIEAFFHGFKFGILGMLCHLVFSQYCIIMIYCGLTGQKK